MDDRKIRIEIRNKQIKNKHSTYHTTPFSVDFVPPMRSLPIGLRTRVTKKIPTQQEKLVIQIVRATCRVANDVLVATASHIQISCPMDGAAAKSANTGAQYLSPNIQKRNEWSNQRLGPTTAVTSICGNGTKHSDNTCDETSQKNKPSVPRNSSK